MTLVELIVALAMLAILASITSRMVFAITSGSKQVTAYVKRNAEIVLPQFELRDIMLHATTEDVFIGRTGAPRLFSGDSSQAHLGSRCRTASGSRAICEVSLATQSSSDGGSVSVTAGAHRFVFHTTASVHVEYLDAALGSGAWITEWKESTRMPIGLAFVGIRDTLVFAIGAPL